VPRALEFARDTLGLPAPSFDRAAFNERIARRQKTDKARRAPPPLHIKCIRDAACEPRGEPPPGTTGAVCEKLYELYVDVLGSSRGGGFHASRIITPDSSDPDRPREEGGCLDAPMRLCLLYGKRDAFVGFSMEAGERELPCM
jgi:hypothetical protein